VLAFTVVMMAGVFQVLFGLLRLGKYITLVPFPVISGFMTGIGVIIILLQLAPLLGYEAVSSVAATVQAVPEMITHPGLGALLLGVLTLGLLFLWPRSLAVWLPSPLMALVLGTLIAMMVFPQHELHLIGTIPSALPHLHWPVIELGLLQKMLVSALMLAALGSIDSLLTSLVADNLSKQHHDSDRELIGQGIGNMVAGCFGGLPGAGATMRTVVNIRAGGKTPVSGMLHAVVLLLIVFGAAPLAEHIPHAVLAGILIKVGLDIIDWKFLCRVHRAPLFVALLMFMVLFLTVFVDLITAVVTGVFLANLYTVKRLSDLQLDQAQLVGDEDEGLSPVERRLLSASKGRLLLYRFNGPVSYGAAKAIHRKLDACSAHDALILDLAQVPYIDVSTAIALEDIILDAQEAGRDVYLVGVEQVVKDVLTRMRVLDLLGGESIFTDRQSALQQASHRLRPVVDEEC
jgi:SulP family sulfate permease